jgi:cytochrome c oxidase subunit 3
MSAQARAGVTGAWLFTAAVAMLFSALASALVIRRGLGGDWGHGVQLPPAVWFSTSFVLLSSLCASKNRWPLAAAASFAFLASQWTAWNQFGLPLSNGPAAAFFYVLTGLHALHVAGGLAVLLTRAAREAVSVYWHALTVLWMVILCLLLWGRS